LKLSSKHFNWLFGRVQPRQGRYSYGYRKHSVWQCPECDSRYVDPTLTLGVTAGVLHPIHPICERCFDNGKGVKINLQQVEGSEGDPTLGFTTVGSTSYPVTTFGQTSTGTTAIGTQYYYDGFKVILTVDYTITEIDVYVGGAGNIKAAIYTDAEPKVLVSGTYTGVMTATGAQWLAGSVAAYLAAASYWIVTQSDTANIRRRTGAAGNACYKSGVLSDYTNFPQATIGSWSTASEDRCYYIKCVQIKGYIKATKAILSESATIESMYLYVHNYTANDQVRVGCYDDASPKVLKFESAATTISSTGWVWIDVPDTALAAATYWLWWQYNGVNTLPSYTAGSSGDGWYKAQAFGSAPATMSGETSSAEKWSLYCQYFAWIAYETFIQYDPTKYSSPTVYLEAVIKATSGTFQVRLFNITDNGPVAGSTLSTTNASYSRQRSGALTLPAAAKEFRVEGYGLGAIKGARLIVDV